MAHLTGTQKKQKKSFIIMLVAIILIAAAIVYVVFEEATSKSDFLDNQKFAAALSEVLSKAPAFIEEEDLAAVEYLGLFYDANEELYQLAIGDSTFLEKYDEYESMSENGEDVSNIDITGYLSSAIFDADENTIMDDVKYFTGVKRVEISDAKFTDSTVFSGMTQLTNATIAGCGLTEVAGFAGLDAEKVEMINLVGNSVTDWSALEYIKDKVLVNQYYTFEPAEDGTINFEDLTLVEQTLTDYLEEMAQQEKEAAEETAEEATEETTQEAPADAE